MDEQEFTRIRALPFRPTAVIMCVGTFLFLSAPIVRLVEDSCGSADAARARASRMRASIRLGSVSSWCPPSNWRRSHRRACKDAYWKMIP